MLNKISDFNHHESFDPFASGLSKLLRVICLTGQVSSRVVIDEGSEDERDSEVQEAIDRLSSFTEALEVVVK